MYKLITVVVIACIPLFTGCSNAPKSDIDNTTEKTIEHKEALTLGRILTTGNGMTLYTYDPEKGATCSYGCSIWPPYGYARNDKPSEFATHKTMVLKTYDQLKVWMINGSPLHTFVGDEKPGDTKSDGVGGWFIAREPLSK